MVTMASRTSQRLQNVCRWSSSREATFNECRKKYWYTYYGSWEGWPKTPFDTRSSIDPLAAYLYMLKNMQPACMFLGSLVHKIIEETLKSSTQTRKSPSAQELTTKASAYLDKALAESQSQQWKSRPKHHCNLFEHYYGLPVGEDEVNAMRTKIHTCLMNWVSSPCTKNIAMDQRSEWLGIESTQTFALEEGVEEPKDRRPAVCLCPRSNSTFFCPTRTVDSLSFLPPRRADGLSEIWRWSRKVPLSRRAHGHKGAHGRIRTADARSAPSSK